MSDQTVDQYFATLPTDEIGPELKSRIEAYYLFVTSFGIYDMWSNSYQQYFSSQLSAGSIVQSGEQGEYSLLKINHYRNIMRNILVMTTAQPPAFDCIATNDDHKSMAQAEVGDSLLEYYMKEESLARYLKNACEYSIVYGEGFLTVEWDTTGDQTYSKDPTTGAPIKEGNLKYMSYSPLDVIRDYHGYSNDYAKDWHIVRQWKNKWDLAAKYPDQADDIIATSEEVTNWLRYDNLNTRFNLDHADLIPLYKFFHRPTEALPKGRITEFLNDECILFDGPLPYTKSPVHRIAGANLDGTIFGYSTAFDLLPIQEALNNLHSIILTNQLTYGVQNILMPEGSNITPSAFTKGLNIVNYNKNNGEPKALQLTATPAEIFNYAKSLVDDMQAISGVNSVVRGDPEASLKSGTALALVQSQAIQFNSDLAEAYNFLCEAIGSATIDTLRLYASVPKISAIAGKSKLNLMPDFKADDLSQINRVSVDMGNPLTKTLSGRVQMAENFIANKFVTSPQQYIEVVETGRLEPVINGPNAELLLIKDENEMLASGNINGQVIATMYDDHALHVKEHKVIQASVEARNNPALMQALLKHMQEHMDLMKQLDPTLAFLLGEQPAPSQAPPTAPQGPTSNGPINNATPPVVQQADGVHPANMPNMPKALVQGQVVPPNPNKIEPPKH